MAYDVAVVGSGPNGLTAAAMLARRGYSVVVFEANEVVGGGCRTAELTLPGFRHDTCASVMPFGIASPAFDELDLTSHGVRWLDHDIEVAHPLDGEPAVLLHRSIDATASGLGSRADGDQWRRLMAPFGRLGNTMVEQLLSPWQIPRHPVAMARFGLDAIRSVQTIAQRFDGRRGPALFTGIAAHAARPLNQRLTAAIGLALGGAGHARGWPVPAGGAQSVTDALVSIITSHGGEIVTGHRVTSFDDLPPTRAVIADVGPLALVRLAGDRLAPRFRRRLDRFRYGNAAFKVDFALSEPVPWIDPEMSRAATVHLGGTFEEIRRAEWMVTAGAPADRPYVLAAQTSAVDPSRAPEGRATLWTYTHVPSRCQVDVTESIVAQIERFAPGFRDTILAQHVTTPAMIESANANFVGGDVSGGTIDIRQMVGRPLIRRSPWTMPIPNVYLCSSSTLPGSGVHGMSGAHAAEAALAHSLR